MYLNDAEIEEWQKACKTATDLAVNDGQAWYVALYLVGTIPNNIKAEFDVVACKPYICAYDTGAN